jgi:two-component system, LytTR family, response regulator
MIRALIVDDEPLVRERIRTLLAGEADVSLAGEADDGLEALNALRDVRADVVFLDIQLPGLGGLEVAEAWRRDGALPVIIFVTAYDQFALEAFRLHAIDYLTKPIDPERFAESVRRAREYLQRPDADDLNRRLMALVEQHERRQALRPYVVVRERERYLMVPTREIQCFEATGNYVRLHGDQGTHLVRSTLARLAERVDPGQFVRVHRSWIVNLACVREAQPWAKGGWILLTRSGRRVPVGQQYHDALKHILE